MSRKEKTETHDERVNSQGQPIIEHLMALRNMIIHCIAAVIVGFAAAFYFLCDPLMAFITSPIEARGIQIIYTAMSEALTTQLKVSLMAGVVCVSPYIFYQIWAFIRPALYDHEIRAFRKMFFIALLLFLLGVFFCYNYVYELAINFFLVAGEGLATPMLSIDKYISFLVSFILPFGVVFELPVAIWMAARVGLVDYRMLARSRKYVFFGIFILAAILTPPDVISQVMLGLPMFVLYEVGVQVARFTKNRRAQEEQKAQKEKK